MVDLNKLVIYELFVPDVSYRGDFKGVVEKLPYLQDLGVNCIELLPVTECSENQRARGKWGYTPIDLFDTREDFGSVEELADLVGEAHGRGIAVLLDIVLNHVDGSHPIVKKHPGYFCDESWGPKYRRWGPNWDFSKREVWTYLVDAGRFWVEKCDIDGYRCDVVSDSNNQKRAELKWDFWATFNKEIRRVKPGLITIAEWNRRQAMDIGFDSAWDITFHSTARRALETETLIRRYDEPNRRPKHLLDEITFIEDYKSDTRGLMCRYVECHDSPNRVAAMDNGLAKSKLAASLLFTCPGVPLMYAGQEIGEKRGLGCNSRRLVKWGDGNDELRAFYKKLIRLRQNKACLVGARMEKIVSGRSVFGYVRRSDEDEIASFLNFSANERTIKSGLNGEWKDCFGGERLVGEKVELGPFESRVFERQG